MIAYLKLKRNDEELIESNCLSDLKESTGIFQKFLCSIYTLFYKFAVFLKYSFNILTVKQIYDSMIFTFPFDLKTAKNKKKKMQKCIKHTKKLMEKYNINTIVLSDEIKNDSQFEKIFEQINKEIYVLNGRGMMPYLIKEIIEYILDKQSRKLELEDLYICVKEAKEIYIDNIKYLMQFFKTINIVTPNINLFQKVSEEIEKNENLIVTVTNNKKKSLKKAKIIVNFDFEEKDIKKYTIYRNSILLTINENGFYEKAGFEGIQILKIEIDASTEIKDFFKKYNLLEHNSLSELYESLINKKQNYSYVREKMKQDTIRIIKIHGKNGEITNQEIIDNGFKENGRKCNNI